MPDTRGVGRLRGITERLRAVVWSVREARVRATWRVLLAWPVLWFVMGTIAVAVGAAIIPARMSLPTNMLAVGLLQGGFFAGALVVWARYLDRRPLADYGLSVSSSWLVELVVGFGAVLVGYGAWHAVGTSLGWTSVEVALAAPQDSLVLGLGAIFVAVAVNVWVQETVFIGVILTNAAEGLSSRGMAPSRAVIGAWAVAVLLFTVKHRPAAPDRVLNLVLALGVFGLLYVHTGELALSIGVHTGVNYVGNALFVSPSVAVDRPTIFHVSNSLSGLLGSLNEGAIPQILLAYLVVVVWLTWRRGEVPIETGLTQWTAR